MKTEKEITYNKNIIHAFLHAVNGIIQAIKTQKNIKIQIIIAIGVTILGFIFNFTSLEFLFLIFACFIVIVTEMINTAIESTVDLYTNEFHPMAKLAKDVAAGAVLVASINSVIVGCILFWDKIF